MAYRVANSNTTLTSTTGWDTVVNTPTMHATTNMSVNTTARYTGTFTAPNTTNKVTGVLLFVTGVGTQDFIITLQENSVDTAATVTVPNANISGNHWVYFRFPTPYQFTSTTAGYYRFKVAGGGGTTATVAADSGGTNACFLATIDQFGAIGASDIIFVQGENGSTTTRTITLDGTVTFGNYGNIGTATIRALDNAFCVSRGGVVNANTAASSNITVKGNTVLVGGEFNVGSTVSPLPSGVVFTYQTDSVLSTDQHGIYIYNGAKFIVQGAPKTNWKGRYVSGLGTAASPMITTADIGVVGDEILVSPTGNDGTNYSQTEYRFIKTKNSATSYVLSNTVGGAEAALTHTHSDKAWVLNLQRNIIIKGGTQSSYVSNSNTTVGNFNVDWARFEKMGSSTTAKLGVQVARSTGMFGEIDYSVAYGHTYTGFTWTTSKYPTSHIGLIVTKNVSGGSVGCIYATSANSKSFTDCFAIGNNRAGFQSTGFNMSFTDCIAAGNNTTGSALTTASGGFYVSGSGVLTDCEITANRIQGMTLGSANYEIINTHIGDYGTNDTDLNIVTDSSISTTYTDCVFGSANRINNYVGMLPGSEVRFHKFNQQDNNHLWYIPTGQGRSTGAGLTDTNVRTPGSLGLRLAPEDVDDGITWEFFIPAKANSIVNFFGWFQKNAAYGTDVATVRLFLPGSAVADAEATLADITDWQAVVLSAQNLNDTDGLAIVRVRARSVTPNAYVYADDFYNAGDTVSSTDKVTGLDTWYNGKPVSIITPQATSAADIWTFPTADLNTPGTTGKILDDVLTVNQFRLMR